MPCIACEELKQSEEKVLCASGAMEGDNLLEQADNALLKDLLRTLVKKINNIESQLNGLASINTRLESLKSGIDQYMTTQNRPRRICLREQIR